MTIKKMNLLPIEYQKEFQVDVLDFVHKAIIAVALVVIVAFIGFGYFQLQGMEQQVEELTSEREHLQAMVVNINKIENDIAKIDQQLQSIGLDSYHQFQFSETIKDIRNATPPDIWYSLIEIQADAVDTPTPVSDGPDSGETGNGPTINSTNINHLTIRGYSQSIASVGSLAYRLNRVPYINNCKIESSHDMDVEGLYLLEFMLTGQITP